MTPALTNSHVHHGIRRGAAAVMVCSGMGAQLPRTVQVGDAAPAQLGMRFIGTHVGAVVPAAWALGMSAGVDLDHLLSLGADFDRSRLRRDQDEAQVVPQGSERLIAI